MTNPTSAPEGTSYPPAMELGPSEPGPTMRSGAIALIVAVMLALLLAASAWGFVNLQSANRANDALKTAQGELAAARGELGAASNQIQAAEGRVSELENRANDLSECNLRWRTSAQEGSALVDLEETRFGLLATGSIWATAFTAREKALIAALANRYQGYLYAYRGSHTKANASIVASNKKVTTADTQRKTMDNEISKMTELGGQIAPARTAFKGEVAELAASCGG